jgi:NADH dehydrogenase FAD-containing subunit
MKSLLLVGAGHVHVAMLERTARLQAAGFSIQLIDPGSFWYGAALTDVLAGRFDRPALRLPLRPFCHDRAVAYRADRAIGLDVRHRRLWLASGDMLEFDTVSLDVGVESVLEVASGSHQGPELWPASDVHDMIAFARALEESTRGGARLHVAVVGDGPRALESVAALACTPWATRLQISWFLPGNRALPGAPAGLDRRVVHQQAERGVEIVPSTSIVEKIDGAICSADGRRFAADHAVIASGQAARFVHAAGLPAHSDGLYVSRRLQSPGDTRVYAVGGGASVLGRRANYHFTVDEQARVLAHNIEAGARRRPFNSCRGRRGGPIVPVGNDRALGWRGRFWWQGQALARLRACRDAAWLALIAGYADRG